MVIWYCDTMRDRKCLGTRTCEKKIEVSDILILKKLISKNAKKAIFDDEYFRNQDIWSLAFYTSCVKVGGLSIRYSVTVRY